MKRNIRTVVKVDRNGEGSAVVGFDRGNAHYGGFVELGTSTQQAQPYLRPALDEAQASGEIQVAFVEAMNKTIEKALGRLGGS